MRWGWARDEVSVPVKSTSSRVSEANEGSTPMRFRGRRNWSSVDARVSAFLMDQGRFFVYILASRSRVLYTGVTRDLLRRVYQHRNAEVPGFSRKYRVNRLVYFEETSSAISAFER